LEVNYALDSFDYWRSCRIGHIFGEEIQKMNEDKNLIIVANAKHTKYANYLIQLIDSKYNAAIYSEKEYRDSQAKIKSSTNVVFLGDSNIVLDQSSTMDKILDKYDMKYFCRGSRAVLHVSKTLFDKIDYESFLKLAQEHGLAFKKPKVKIFTKKFWFDIKVANPAVAKKVVYPESVYDQLFNCLIKIFFDDYIEDFVG
jgi:hypothetical protein